MLRCIWQWRASSGDLRSRTVINDFRAAVLVALLLAGAVPSSAWGPAGHRVVAEMAVPSLPVFFPSFVRQNEALILFLSLEPDRWRDAGQSPLQAATAPDHYIEFEKLSFLPTLPPDRYRFYQDLFERRRQLRARRRLREADALLPQRVGLQPYATAEVYGRLVIAWQQYQQAVTTRARSTAQQAVLFYMGWLAHYVADGAQPLHTTQHSDGWFGPNPNGYSTRPGLHAKTEDAFINQSGLEGSLRSQRVQPQRLQDPFADYVAYLRASFALVPRLYDLEKAGAFDGNGTAEGKDFIAKRLTAAAAMVAGLWVNAYETSRTPP